jgi:hypothetical protein
VHVLLHHFKRKSGMRNTAGATIRYIGKQSMSSHLLTELHNLSTILCTIYDFDLSAERSGFLAHKAYALIRRL